LAMVIRQRMATGSSMPRRPWTVGCP